jgi:RimJ/RimL family protein N-acetyltransferase
MLRSKIMTELVAEQRPRAQRVETERLWLEPLRLDDAAQVQPLFAQWEVVEYLADRVPWPFPADGVLAYYRDSALPAMERGEEWHWTLRLKTDPATIIGSIGLIGHGENHRGFWLDPRHHRRGLMTEAVVAVNDFWFEALGYEVLRAPKAIANQGSRRISEKTGMRVVVLEERGFVSGRLPAEIWEITAEEWAAWKRARLRSP